MALPDSPLTRGEQYLTKIAGQETALPDVPPINEELAKNDVVTITIFASKDSLAVKGVWHAGMCQLV